MADPNLITTCSFHGKEYLVKMNINNNCLELYVTQKVTGEEWQCNYNQTYIENLTQKTGNFKQFHVFVVMLKSGLLKTSDSVTLDLLTYEDLQLLRTKRSKGTSNKNGNNNRRYLIVTYTVEFDKINYPLPLEYNGPPDPTILQSTIRRLECEVTRLRSQSVQKLNFNERKEFETLRARVEELTNENKLLRDEVQQLNQTMANNRRPKTQVQMLQKAIISLEKSVLSERASHHQLVEKLKEDKIKLSRELQKVKKSETDLKLKLKKTRIPSPNYTNRKYSKIQRQNSGDYTQSDYEMEEIHFVGDRNVFMNNNARSRSVSPTPKQVFSGSKPATPRTHSIAFNKKTESPSRNSRSRNSSISSNSRTDIPRLNLISSRDQSPASDKRRSRRSSRSSNASSNSRTWDMKTNNTSNKNSRRKMNTATANENDNNNKQEDFDFRHLEGRIHALQKMLKDGLTFK